MRGELLFVQHPFRVHAKWLAFYVLLLIAAIFGMTKVAAHIRTHTIPFGQMELEIPYTRYVLGEDVTFTLTNHFNGIVFVSNNCPEEPLMVFRQESSRWVRIHDEASETDCPSEAREIGVKPNGIVTGSFSKWKHLFDKPGKYRVVAYVEYYNSLPYDDFEVVAKKAAVAAKTTASSAPVLNAKYLSQQKQSSPTIISSGGSSGTTGGGTSGGTSGGSSGGTYTSVPYTVNVTSAGNFSLTNLTLKATDSIIFVYSPPIGDEVVISFSPAVGTRTSLTLDHERTSRQITFTNKGTWTIRVSGHSGNTLTVVVN